MTLFLQDEDLADVAAKQYYVEYGKEMLPDRLLNLLPSYLPESQLQGSRVGLERWAHLVMSCHKKVCYSNKYILRYSAFTETGATHSIDNLNNRFQHF